MARDIAIAVVEEEGRFLIGQRPPGVALAGLWEFPGGKVESGETPLAAAVRECAEETGLEVEAIDIYDIHDHAYDHGDVRLHFFRCRPVDPRQPPQPPFRWVARSELGNYDFPRGNDAILTRLRDA